MALELVTHPLVQHKLGLLRHAGISTKSFRELVNELAALLTYEATRHLMLEPCEIEAWDGTTIQIQQIKGKKVNVVPILRAGMGMLEGVLSQIPSARVSMVGLYRDEQTLEPITYFENYCDKITERLSIVIDPMLATGGSLNATLDKLKAQGAKQIKVLVLVAAPEGVAAVHTQHPDVVIYTAALDSHLNEQSYIIPGLGDAGDKLFGTT